MLSRLELLKENKTKKHDNVINKYTQEFKISRPVCDTIGTIILI